MNRQPLMPMVGSDPALWLLYSAVCCLIPVAVLLAVAIISGRYKEP
jgi:hypothetical protein